MLQKGLIPILFNDGLTPEYKAYKARVAADSGTLTIVNDKNFNDQIKVLKRSGVYDSASLICVPSGIKTNKLYSLKPTDGSGDFTFSRNSVKWVRGKDGYYREAPVNVPALEWSPTAQKFGVLAEPQATNLLLRSWDFSNVYWSKLNVAIDNNTGAGFDCPFVDVNNINLKRGFKLIENNTINQHFIYTNPSQFYATSGKPYTFSFFAKKAERDFVVVSFKDSNAVFRDDRVWFNLNSGEVATKDVDITASIAHIGDGWYRCTATRTALSTNNAVIYLHIAPADFVISYQGINGYGVYLCQVDLCQSEAPGSPIFTDGATVTRLADVASVTIPTAVTKITTTVNGVDVVDNSPTPGATYTMPNGSISKIIME